MYKIGPSPHSMLTMNQINLRVPSRSLRIARFIHMSTIAMGCKKIDNSTSSKTFTGVSFAANGEAGACYVNALGPFGNS